MRISCIEAGMPHSKARTQHRATEELPGVAWKVAALGVALIYASRLFTSIPASPGVPVVWHASPGRELQQLQQQPSPSPEAVDASAGAAAGAAASGGGGIPHKPLVPLSKFDVSLLVVAAIVLFIAAGAGMGGGPLLVPAFLLLGQFNQYAAVALSNATICAGSLASVTLNLRKRHPTHNKPLVDWDIMLLMVGLQALQD